MRKTFMLALVLCLVAAFAVAQSAPPPATGATTGTTTGTTGTTGGGKTTGTKHAAAATHKAKAKTASGDVASVDDTAKTFTVHPKKGSDWTFGTNDKTSYWVGKKKGTWADVKAGAGVTVTYTVEGTTNTATKVRIKAEKAPKAPKAPKTTGTGR